MGVGRGMNDVSSGNGEGSGIRDLGIAGRSLAVLIERFGGVENGAHKKRQPSRKEEQ